MYLIAFCSGEGIFSLWTSKKALTNEMRRKRLKISIANHTCYELIFVLCPSLARLSKFEIYFQVTEFQLRPRCCDKKNLPSSSFRDCPYDWRYYEMQISTARTVQVNFESTCFDRKKKKWQFIHVKWSWILLRKVRTTHRRNAYSVNVSRNLARYILGKAFEKYCGPKIWSLQLI